jgi:hypothetical protein
MEINYGDDLYGVTPDPKKFTLKWEVGPKREGIVYTTNARQPEVRVLSALEVIAVATSE